MFKGQFLTLINKKTVPAHLDEYFSSYDNFNFENVYLMSFSHAVLR